jgi:flagellar basal body-associated protein FliL
MYSLPIPLFIVPVGLFALIVYFAVSKKSTLFIRWAAVVALMLIGISVLVCLFFLFGEPSAVVVKGPVVNIVPDEGVIPVKKGNPLPLLIVSIIVVLFIAFVVYTALKEQHRSKNQKDAGGQQSPDQPKP